MDTATVPLFRVPPNGWKSLPKMTEHSGDGYLADVYENPEGSPMCSGFFELRHAEPRRLARVPIGLVAA